MAAQIDTAQGAVLHNFHVRAERGGVKPVSRMFVSGYPGSCLCEGDAEMTTCVFADRRLHNDQAKDFAELRAFPAPPDSQGKTILIDNM